MDTRKKVIEALLTTPKKDRTGMVLMAVGALALLFFVDYRLDHIDQVLITLQADIIHK